MMKKFFLTASMIALVLVGYSFASETLEYKHDGNAVWTTSGADNVCAWEEISRAENILGMQMVDFNQKADQGMSVDSVIPGSPVDLAGIERGDTIVSISGISLVNELTGVAKIENYLSLYGDGTGVTLTYSNDSGVHAVTLEKINMIEYHFVCSAYELTEADDVVIESVFGVARRIALSAETFAEKVEKKVMINDLLDKVRFMQTTPRLVKIIEHVQYRLMEL